MQRSRLGGFGSRDGQLFNPSALALVPGLGLVVREWANRRVQVFTTRDAIAMDSMSEARVGWMVGVARSILHRASAPPT